ncbi:pyridoxamine 5'-phosphate oxidase [Mucilaginibacter myungsuensis]|uniref:Pyridoxine/pyridoxamine 5'-phosphate oxidase n=1 Tax=Mucilaginibacter myungsuensis TaxID=649104 RepID=A0A929L635_9SPHI|nr:pyridoxamine 5'-phosphate oxidase [Mucilaginibacter myungsuensis]MBE9664650.1 pyridoxamine 5'-phosphate oxidase [Mucilaginibacter myungsuensis]MDN3601144.1 pyridoxamine 5'-phosphate oxidase [Mucilaginibacter myungsuensis]
MDNQELQNLRQDYSAATLTEKEVKQDPIRQFEKWFEDAVAAEIHEPNAMTLATATPNGHPSARIVLLKGFNKDGFMFYTNYLSRKGKELAKNPLASVVFFWGELERQVRIEGTIEKLSREQSEEYFHTRPKLSQLGALASAQSQEIEGRKGLEQKMAELETEYAEKDVPKPSYWGGYIIKPRLVEFWQGRRSRLHDRIIYKKIDNKTWKIARLAP